MSLEVFGGGDEEDLVELAAKYDYTLCEDNLWRNADQLVLTANDARGLTDEQMWEYVNDRREGDIEDMLEYEASRE